MTEGNISVPALETQGGGTSPFDSIMLLDHNGEERWSARDLQRLMGYDRWERFDEVVRRAKEAVDASGLDSLDHFRGAAKVITGGRWGRQKVSDYRLTRFGAYHVALAGDGRKPEVAAAKTYFAVQTRKAEIATSRPMSELEMAKQYVAALEREQQLAKELEVAAPKAGKWDRFLNSEGLIGMTEMADMLGTDVRTMTNWLVEVRIFRKQVSAGSRSPRNLPRKAFQDGGQFRVLTETKSRVSFPVAYATARGLDLVDDLWRQKNIR